MVSMIAVPSLGKSKREQGISGVVAWNETVCVTGRAQLSASRVTIAHHLDNHHLHL